MGEDGGGEAAGEEFGSRFAGDGDFVAVRDDASMLVRVTRPKRALRMSQRQRRSARMGEPSARVKMW